MGVLVTAARQHPLWGCWRAAVKRCGEFSGEDWRLWRRSGVDESGWRGGGRNWRGVKGGVAARQRRRTLGRVGEECPGL